MPCYYARIKYISKIKRCFFFKKKAKADEKVDNLKLVDKKIIDKNKKDKFRSSLQWETDTEVGVAFNNLYQSSVDNMVRLKKDLKKQGVDTTEVDDWLKKYVKKLQ